MKDNEILKLMSRRLEISQKINREWDRLTKEEREALIIESIDLDLKIKELSKRGGKR